MSKRLLGPATVPEGKPAYSPAVAYDLGGHTMVFIAGQIAVDTDGNTVAAGDAGEQTRFVFEKIKALLAGIDADLNDLVKVQIFVTDADDIPDVSRVRNAYLRESLPVSTLLQVEATVRPDCCVEIEGMAIRSN